MCPLECIRAQLESPLVSSGYILCFCRQGIEILHKKCLDLEVAAQEALAIAKGQPLPSVTGGGMDGGMGGADDVMGPMGLGGMGSGGGGGMDMGGPGGIGMGMDMGAPRGRAGW